LYCIILYYIVGPQGKGFGAASDPFDSEYMEQLQDRLIPREHLELGNALGQGQFGKVFAGSLEMKSGLKKKVAVKTMKSKIFCCINIAKIHYRNIYVLQHIFYCVSNN